MTHLLTTHSHPDHVAGDAELVERYGVEIVKGPLETGGLTIEALETPGHASDHLAFVANETVAFTADILFKDAVGGGPDAVPIRASVMDTLMTLPHEVRVLPGHTDETTIGREWEENPFIRYWRGDCGLDRRGGSRRRRGRDADRLVARLRRQGQGAGPLLRRARGDHRRLAGGAMSFIVEEPIEEYAERHTTPPDPLLAELAAETKATMSAPQMLTGPIEGRFLELLVAGTGAKRVLEIGTFTGYSALSMAAAMPPDGRIDTLDIEPKHAEVAQRYFDRSPDGGKITLHLGPALETIEQLDGEFDFVFIDADKENYDAYFEAVLPRLSEGGLIAIDNTLWSGRVLDPPDETTKLIAALNDKLAADDRVVVVQLTVRDGVTLIRRR